MVLFFFSTPNTCKYAKIPKEEITSLGVVSHQASKFYLYNGYSLQRGANNSGKNTDAVVHNQSLGYKLLIRCRLNLYIKTFI